MCHSLSQHLELGNTLLGCSQNVKMPVHAYPIFNLVAKYLETRHDSQRVCKSLAASIPHRQILIGHQELYTYLYEVPAGSIM